MQIHNDEIYTGGYFENAETLQALTLAKWDGNSWHMIKGLGIAGNEFLPGGVRAVEFVNNKMYVVGDFTKAGDLYVNNIAEWDYTNSEWKKLDDGSPSKGIHDGYISALERVGDAVYAGVAGFDLCDDE